MYVSNLTLLDFGVNWYTTPMNEERQRRQIERLEQKRERLNQWLDGRRARINERFDEKQAELNGRLNQRQEQIIAAALELLAEQGLNSLSLRDIAKRIHLQAPALYWYFKSKDDLIDYMAEAILQKEFQTMQPRQDGQTWQDWLTQHMLRLRRAMLAYPDGARVVAGARLYPALTLALSLETALMSLYSGGVDLQTARRITMTAKTYTFGYVIEEQSAPTAEQLQNIDVDAFFAPYPHIAQAMDEATQNQRSPDEDFIIGLQYIVRGGAQAT